VDKNIIIRGPPVIKMFYGTYLIVINTSDYKKSSKEPKKYVFVAIG
jgi:hypothetical protein